MSPTDQYRENFIAAMYQVMARERLNLAEFAAWLGVNRVTAYRINDRKQLPTVEQGIELCMKARLDANWLFLNRPSAPRPVTQKLKRSETRAHSGL